MKKLIVCFFVAVLMTGCSTKDPSINKAKPPILSAIDLDENGGADSYNSIGDHSDSIYYKNPDFYSMTSNQNLIILPKFKTMQQTTEWSCGNVATLMVLNHLNITDFTEEQLALGMKSSTDMDVENAPLGSANNYYEYGTDVKRMAEYLITLPQIQIVETSYKSEFTPDSLLSEINGVTENDYGNLPASFVYNALYTTENLETSENYVEDAKDSFFVKWLKGHLDKNRGILVEYGDWDGHWVVIIGYDSMNTPQIGDDMLIFADPYDTSDHWQDGYAYFPLEKFFSMWKDRNVASKPYQIQPYMIIEKK